jgi:LuxR family transcriptional regulator, maltose regulon positive regulatory protein
MNAPTTRDDAPRDADPALPHRLLEAKLQVPRQRPGMVHRTRVLRRLRAAGERRVISFVAPPGYGKTSALVQWASQDPRRVAWLTVDDGDNDPVVLLTYLAAAIDRLEPLDPGIFDAIASPGVPDRAVVGRLLAAVSGRAEPILVVIDDAHLITDQGCLDALAELITYVPGASQVALAGREPFALPLARWRADESMLEIGPDDLAMDAQEASVLASRLGLTLSAEWTTQLTRRTEGWPALLALAALEVRRSPREDRHILAGSSLHIADYLRSEILEGRPEDEIVFLTRTSILERLSGPLCDLVAGRSGSTGLLARLARSTLLVDEYGGSYRYHTLLRDFLQGELAIREPGEVAGLHRRAAAWHAENGALDLAVEHAFTAGDLDLAATAASRGMLLYHWSGRGATVRGWLRRFGDDALQERPWLAVLAAWEQIGLGDLATIERFADIAERGWFEGRPPDGTASFESGRAMLRAVMGRAGADDMLTNATRAVQLEAAGGPWRDFALWVLSFARITGGDQVGAHAALDEAVAAGRRVRNGLTYCILGHRALVAVDQQDWTAAAAFAEEARAIGVARQVEGYIAAVPARIADIRIAIHRGDVGPARQELARAVTFRPVMTAEAPAVAIVSLLGLARAHVAIGDPAGARALLAQAGSVIRLRPDLGVLPGEVAALRAAIASLPPTLVGGASTLTAAELRVLALLPYYLSFKEIGQRLGVKGTTVKTHALAIYGKLGASTRSEAVDLAVDAGLLERFPSGPAVSAIEEDATPRDAW